VVCGKFKRGLMANLTHNLNTFEEIIQIRKLIASIY